MKRKMWTQDEIDSVYRLKEAGMTPQQIAKQIGRSQTAVYFRLAGKYDPEHRAKRNAEYRMEYPSRAVDMPVDARPPMEVIAERNRRMSLPCRDLTASLFGDPPVGLSALERRS